MPTEANEPSRRIAYVITDLQVGGVPLHLLRLSSEMQRLGHTVRVISLAPPGRVAQRLQAEGIETRSCHAGGPWSLSGLYRLWAELRRFKPDIVHALLFHANIACRLVGPLAGIRPRRLICEIQTVEVQRRWHLTVDRWTHWLCREEIGNSPSVIEHLKSVARLPEHKLRLVGGGVDAMHFANAEPLPRSELDLQDDDDVVLWTGRLDPVKGLSDLVQAVKMLKTRRSFRILLAGEGAQRAQLEGMIADHGLDQEIRLLGVRDDVARLLKSCDVFVLPSLTEGLPNSLLEAMAAGCPVVATDVPGNRDLITHERNGLVVPPSSPGALTDALHRLLSDTTLAKQLAQKAQVDVQRGYDLKHLFAKYLSAYYSHDTHIPYLADHSD